MKIKKIKKRRVPVYFLFMWKQIAGAGFTDPRVVTTVFLRFLILYHLYKPNNRCTENSWGLRWCSGKSAAVKGASCPWRVFSLSVMFVFSPTNVFFFFSKYSFKARLSIVSCEKRWNGQVVGVNGLNQRNLKALSSCGGARSEKILKQDSHSVATQQLFEGIP